MSLMLKDKIILVVYVPIDYMNASDVSGFISDITKSLRSLEDESSEFIVVPTRNLGEYKVECINPVLLDEKKYSEVEQTADKFKMIVNNFLKQTEENGKTSD